jgi:hypothetical protein
VRDRPSWQGLSFDRAPRFELGTSSPQTVPAIWRAKALRVGTWLQSRRLPRSRGFSPHGSVSPFSDVWALSGHRGETTSARREGGDLIAQVTSGPPSGGRGCSGSPARPKTKQPTSTWIPEEPASLQSKRPKKPFRANGFRVGLPASLVGRPTVLRRAGEVGEGKDRAGISVPRTDPSANMRS